MLKQVLMYVMALGYIVAGINHFWHPNVYLKIMPPYLPAPQFLNYATGVIEIVLGFLICLKPTRTFAAWSIALLLVIFLTVHIYMQQQALQVEGYIISPTAAWVRLALQPLLIAWALWYRR